MSYLLKMLAVLASVLVMAGCGLQLYAKDTDVTGYPYRHADFDYKYAWKMVPTDHGVMIEGVMKNVRYAFIDSVAMKVEVLDRDGKFVARASDFPMPQQTREGDVIHFSLLLSDIKPAAGDTFQFTVHYKANEGDVPSGIDWISIFKVNALTGTVISPQSRNLDNW